MNFQNDEPEKQPQLTFRETIRSITSYSIPAAIALILIALLLIFRTEIKRVISNNSLEDFSSMIVTEGFHSIALDDGRHWKISYEEDSITVFTGLARHSSPFHSDDFAILSHDLLITTGDFADSALVSVNVSNHHFRWNSITDASPQGSIHLLHTLPIDQAVYLQLTQIEAGNQVTIRGYEIYRIDGWNASGQSLGYWKDAGCNTILVTEVINEDVKQ